MAEQVTTDDSSIDSAASALSAGLGAENKMELDKVKLGHSPLTDTIFLYRHGKDPALALDKREAEADVMAVLVAHMMHGTTKGSEKVITLGEQQYTIRVTPNV